MIISSVYKHGMPIVESIVVETNQPEIRLCDYCKNRFIHLPSGKSLKKALDTRRILVNGDSVHATTLVKSGDVLELFIAEHLTSVLEITLHTYYSDDDIALIEKPAGLSSSGNLSRSVQHYVSMQFAKSSAPDAIFPARIVHRLDKATSGLMLIARSANALMKLGQALEERSIKKTYTTIVHGQMENKGIISTEIDNKSACTTWVKIADILHSNSPYCLLELQPESGRKHQLRIHLSSIGFPIAGDTEYTISGNTIKGRGMMLHASHLEFEHPGSGVRMKFQSELPKRFRKFIERSKI